MPDYRIDAEVSVDDGPWEPYSSKHETAERDAPSPRKAALGVKFSVALSRTGKDTSRVRVRKARVIDLEG